MSQSSHSTHYQSLVDKIIFITGGASGIGAAMVKAFVYQGAKVAFVDIDKLGSMRLLSALEGDDGIRNQPWFKLVDVIDSDALQTAIDDAHAHFNGLDVMVNNVANDARQDVEKVSAYDWHKCMQINLDPAFFASQTAFKYMREKRRGSIINFSSITALIGLEHGAGYVTAKAGLMGMTKALARDFGEYEIRVNSILPGWIATDRQLSTWLTEAEEHKWMEYMALKKRILPSDVANLALFLASDDSALITGQGINIDGGRT